MTNDLSRQRNQTGTPCECNEPSAAVSQNHASDERLISRQLCELCGIEYEKTITDDVEAFVPYQVTLDFTKPENFVRLFDLTLPQKGIPTIAEFVTYEHLTITDSKDFLAKLIEMLKDDSYVADIKQSIRETEWVYE